MYQTLKICTNERGVVLIVALVIVLLTGILGLAAMRGSGLQESMAGNMRERNLAFQVTESALREGEAIVLADGELPSFNGEEGRHLERTPAESVLRFTSDNWQDEDLVKLVSIDLGNTGESPSYIIEELAADLNKGSIETGSAKEADAISLEPIHYRITARGVGVSKDSVVILQSTIKRVP